MKIDTNRAIGAALTSVALAILVSPGWAAGQESDSSVPPTTTSATDAPDSSAVLVDPPSTPFLSVEPDTVEQGGTVIVSGNNWPCPLTITADWVAEPKPVAETSFTVPFTVGNDVDLGTHTVTVSVKCLRQLTPAALAPYEVQVVAAPTTTTTPTTPVETTAPVVTTTPVAPPQEAGPGDSALPWIVAALLIGLGSGVLLHRQIRRSGKHATQGIDVLPQPDSAPRITTEADPSGHNVPAIRLDIHRGEPTVTVTEEDR
jgi:hypothetical protein